MKLLLTLALFITTNAFAVNLCSFEETWQFNEALEAQRIKPIRISKNHSRFTFAEKQMIHRTVTLQDWLKGTSKAEAMEIFAAMFNGQPGENAGEIVYLNVHGKEIAVVHYWPGDNEYGAYYEMKNGAFRLIAEIGDSFITCK